MAISHTSRLQCINCKWPNENKTVLEHFETQLMAFGHVLGWKNWVVGNRKRGNGSKNVKPLLYAVSVCVYRSGRIGLFVELDTTRRSTWSSTENEYQIPHRSASCCINPCLRFYFFNSYKYTCQFTLSRFRNKTYSTFSIFCTMLH